VIEAVLTAGVLLSGTLLAAGLLLNRPPLLRGGILLLLATPVARVVVVTAGLLRQRDWLFALVSLWILAVLASGISVAVRGGGGSSRQAAPLAGRAP
jgi:uncharacterized membrane protein